MRYPGGKGKTYQHIINLMPPHRVYIETHLGGGSVMRHKRAALLDIGIDVDQRVISNWPVGSPDAKLICGRAEDFLKQYHFEGHELIYADPPYHPETRLRKRVYRHDYSEKDHERFLEILMSLPCMVILSGYENSLYRDTLLGWRTQTFLAKTHTGIRRETLWLNFDPPKSLHDDRYLGDNFRSRQTVKRRLQRLKNKVNELDPIERAAFSKWLNETHALAS